MGGGGEVASNPRTVRAMSPRQIGGGFSVFGRKLKELHEEFPVTGSYCFATDCLPIGESAERHYR
jgi:hypothetical protein